MRSLISLCAIGLVAAMPLSARANEASCVSTLLEAPVAELYAGLRINHQQAARLQAIRYTSTQRRAELERQLEQVRAARAYGNTWQLEQQEAELLGQLEAEPARALEQVRQVLAPWQLDRCTGEPIYRPPVVVVQPRPRVVVHRAPPVRRQPPRGWRPPRQRRPAPRVVPPRARRPRPEVTPPRTHRAPEVRQPPARERRAPRRAVRQPAPKRRHRG